MAGSKLIRRHSVRIFQSCGRRTVAQLFVCLLVHGQVLLAQAAVDLDDIQLPPGFSIAVWADNVPNARSMALGDRGTVFVATRRDGRVFALSPNWNSAPAVVTVAKGLKVPNGVAFFDGALYVAENHRITRYPDIENTLDSIPEPETIVTDLPTESHHGWRYINFGPDGKLYISIGAPCNVCDRAGFANISRMNPDGSGREMVASGVRNSVGFTWHPESGDLWFTDNGRDMLGDDVPPGELNHVSGNGQHFGFPYCHGGDVPDPEFGKERSCSEFVPPAMKLGAHVAPLGLLFYTGRMFPEEYRGQAFIAEHGSWNRSKKVGYRVSLVRFEHGLPTSYDAFAEGWLQGQDVAGRPVDLLEMPDGSLLLSDDQNGVIYRISYSAQQ